MAIIKRGKQETTVIKTVRVKELSQLPLMREYIKFSGISEDPEDKDGLSYLLTESFMHMAAKDRDFITHLKETYKITKDRNILEEAAASIVSGKPNPPKEEGASASDATTAE